eukprot:COSAG01_NODE_578_length_15259_cov_10.160950_4_plen_106_part_00
MQLDLGEGPDEPGSVGGGSSAAEGGSGGGGGGGSAAEQRAATLRAAARAAESTDVVGLARLLLANCSRGQPPFRLHAIQAMRDVVAALGEGAKVQRPLHPCWRPF